MLNFTDFECQGFTNAQTFYINFHLIFFNLVTKQVLFIQISFGMDYILQLTSSHDVMF